MAKREDLNALYKIGKRKWQLAIGFGENEEELRVDYNHLPTEDELRDAITSFIDAKCKKRIIENFVFNEIPVYLSPEQQSNITANYNHARATKGTSLPYTIKGGTVAQPVYITFASMAEFEEFYGQMLNHITTEQTKCWQEKDSIDYDDYKDVK